jgi:hypothetical protein
MFKSQHDVEIIYINDSYSFIWKEKDFAFQKWFKEVDHNVPNERLFFSLCFFISSFWRISLESSKIKLLTLFCYFLILFVFSFCCGITVVMHKEGKGKKKRETERDWESVRDRHREEESSAISLRYKAYTADH